MKSIPSISSIKRFIKNDLKNFEERGIPKYSFKRVSSRGIDSNTPANKESRIKAVEKLRDYIHGGAKWVCVDETSWSIAQTPAYGWSEEGKQCIITKCKNGLRMTSCCSIDCDGTGYCNLILAENTLETFDAYFKRLMKYYDDQQRKCVFWCDNCNIHNHMLNLVKNTNHVVVFNSAYSPELNPIENIFGIWKNSIEKEMRTYKGITSFIKIIKDSFENISPEICQRTFERVRNEIWPQVFNRKDI